MSELSTAETSRVDAVPNAITAGAMLRSAREASGLHVAALAVSMKVPVKKLEALESDRLDLLPDAVFVRALAASVCRALKIDAAPVLDRLPIGSAPRLNSEERGINTPFRVRGERSDWSITDFFSKPAVIVVAILVLSALGVAFFTESQTSDNASGTPENLSIAISRAQESAKISELEPGKPASEIVQSAPSVVSAVPTVPVEDRNAAMAASATTGTDLPSLLTFRAKGASWIQVTDAKGVILLNKTLMTGESVGVPGAPPVFVVIGRVDVTEVDVRGKPMNLSEVSKENVARFEVK